ncbi:PEP-CTERM sorting domain-containing protein [Candidatus Poribacteria bacterium]|nr:PEP-CTERM sorting domain-containing protein [Candidatus Poribacteria bacterium]
MRLLNLLKKQIVFLIIFSGMVFLQPLFTIATTYTSITNGNWQTLGTWSPSGTPRNNDIAYVNHNITMSANNKVTLAVTPEPSSWILMLIGFSSLAVFKFKDFLWK